jgi:DNA primase
MNVAEQIKNTLDLRSVIEYYGVRFNRRGFALCPFHNEKTASLSVKGRYFKCFGCGVGGGVIDFVMLYFNLTFTQAITKINNDFRLGLTNKKPNYRQRRQAAQLAKKRRDEKKERIRLREEYLEQVQVYQYLQSAIYKYAPTDPESGDWHPVFVYAAQHLGELEHWLDQNIDRLAVG